MIYKGFRSHVNESGKYVLDRYIGKMFLPDAIARRLSKKRLKDGSILYLKPVGKYEKEVT